MKEIIQRSCLLLLIWIFAEQKGLGQQTQNESTHTAFQQASKMKILYVGLENPIEIGAPGIPESDLNVLFTSFHGGGVIKKKDKSHYIAIVSEQGLRQIDIYDGATVINSQKYMCYNIPDPYLTLGGKYKGGEISANILKGQSGVVTVLENFNFDFNAPPFSTESFTMTYESKGELVKVANDGPIFSDQIKSIFSNVSPKDIIVISDIIAIGPDGKPRHLAPIAFVVI